MDIYTLCDKIQLQPAMKQKVLEAYNNIDFKTIDTLQKGYFIYENMKENLDRVRELLGEDGDGIKILTCMLKAAVDAYAVYQEKGISDEVYIATMKCFTRFIDETYKMTGKLCFDRYWWTTRQVGCHLFRISELEYEMKHLENEVVIGIHIPSDADFSPSAVDKSLQGAHVFFETFYPALKDAEYRCHTWLLDNHLKCMLKENSNILQFQNRFEIFDEGEADTEFIEWLYQTKSVEYHTLPVDTSLRRNMKEHLLAGGVIRNAYGRIK